jgi:hypothetical protein
MHEELSETHIGVHEDGGKEEKIYMATVNLRNLFSLVKAPKPQGSVYKLHKAVGSGQTVQRRTTRE